jgi:hypothetical protein
MQERPGHARVVLKIKPPRYECRLRKPKRRVGERFLRNPPGVAQQPNAFFNEGLAAQLMGYGTNYLPHPPYMDSVAA